ncbi:MAG: C2 family cysteine protease [Methanoregula sp.]|nr:C2 family cysteine protease [Methanoregula sp.]
MPDCVQPSWSISGVFGATPNVKDPVQGPVLENCSLIAAFASLAWKGRISLQTGSPYKFTFNRIVNGNVIGETQYADTILPADSTGKIMHARSDDTSKYWPAIYEKAYYMWLQNVDTYQNNPTALSDALKSASGRPLYCPYRGAQNPITVLFQLTGYRVEDIIKKTSTTNAGDVFKSADTVFADIDNWCDNCPRSLTNQAIRTPAVAWTRDTGTEYSDTTIVVQHTYSLLGVAGTKDSNQNWITKYIVLRNPYGKVRKDPASGSVSVYTAGGLWCSTNIYLSDPNDGIFAISAADFFKYFAGYAWTPV